MLHGGLQGALRAAAIRLSEATNPDAALVQIIRSDIEQAVERIDDGLSGRAELRHTLDEIRAIWTGHRQVTVCVEAESALALASDHDADSATAEVVGEAVNNALRHGRARSVSIEIGLIDLPDSSSPDLKGVQVVVSDDGSGWSSDAGPGLGSVLFDDLCSSWRDADTGSRTQLVAIVSLQRWFDDSSEGSAC